MARGKQCPYCKAYMYAQTEEHKEAGTYVTYVCPDKVKCKHIEKVFEDKK